MRRSFLSISLGICFLLAGSVFGAIPKQISYQGTLSGSGGAPLVNTTVSVEFRIYDAQAGGNSKWIETQSVTTDGLGRFIVILGSVAPIEDTVFNQSERYLSINVASNGEMAPRSKIAAVAYANRVSTVDGATGGNISGSVGIGILSPTAGVILDVNGAIKGNTFTNGANPLMTANMILQPETGTSVLVVPKTNLTQFFQVQNEAGQAALNVDAVNRYVGIGTGAPLSDLHIESSNPISTNLRMYNTSATGDPDISFLTDGVFQYTLGVDNDDNDKFKISGGSTLNSSERLTITPTGFVGIGTTSPSSKLEVVGDLKVSGNIIGSTPWTAFPYTATFQDYEDGHPGLGNQRVQYRKIGDLVYMRGMTHKVDHSGIGSSGEYIGTLPEGFRPPSRVHFMSDNGLTQVRASGEVYVVNGLLPGAEHHFMDGTFFSTSP